MGVLGRMAAIVAVLASTSASASADVGSGAAEGSQGAPNAAPADAARLATAAEAFDAGSAAFKRKDYEAAAASFEAAYVAVPGAKALRLAIRSHAEAGHGARAATLAALAQQRYAGDAATLELAAETLEQLEPLLQRVQVTCSPACALVAGAPEALPGEPSTRWVVYVDPGKPMFRASFGQGLPDASKEVIAVAGRLTSVTLEVKPKPAPAVVAPVPAPAPEPLASKPEPAVAPPPPAAPQRDEASPARRGGMPRGVFYGALAATAVVGGVTVWSGLDTIGNPGADAVKAACAGKGEACPEYQAGRAHQTRTNALIGATVGTAVVTGVIGLFLTDWKGASTTKSAAVPGLLPSALVLDRGAVLGTAGRF